jgi:putative addiction module component (TIGR02574 family)
VARDKLEFMSSAAHRLIEEALALPEDARTELLEALIESLDGPGEALDEVEAAWADEIAERLRAVEAGSVKPIPWEEARKAIFGSRNDDASRR